MRCAAISSFRAAKNFFPPSFKGAVATRSFWAVGKFHPLVRQASTEPTPAKATRAEAIATAGTNLLRIRTPLAALSLCSPSPPLPADYVAQ